MNKVLSIGEIAKRSGVNISTLHFYEEKNLISSSRNSGNQRQYTRDTLRRIAIIRAGKKIGLSLEEIKNGFSSLPDGRTPTIKDWEKLARTWKHRLNMKIESLQKLQDSLTSCIGCGCLSLKKMSDLYVAHTS